MKLDDYQRAAAAHPLQMPGSVALATATREVLSLIEQGRAGALTGTRAANRYEMTKRLGEALRAVSTIADQCALDLSECAAANITHLTLNKETA